LWVVAVSCAIAAGCISPPRERVEQLPETPYPSCPDGEAAERPLFAGELRAGPAMREQSAVEHFRAVELGCHVVFTGSLDWDLGATDLEIVYDRDLRPLRAWKRSTSPGPLEASRRTDVRAYDFGGDRLVMRRRGPADELELWRFRWAPPSVIIGPGRGLLSVWLRRAHLAVGGRVREPAVDIREASEVVRDVTLQRYEDRDEPGIGRVRVYTIYGREPIFADENDVVVGDMMGMRPSATVAGPLPPAVPRDGPPDPRGTP
jgi:hypothetical protein